MKNINYFAHKFLAGAVALAIVSLAVQAFAEDVPQVITVIKIKGHARYSADNKSWMTLRMGDVLHAGSVIQTAEESTVDIALGEPGGVHASPLGAAMPAPPSVAASGGAPVESGPKANLIRIFSSSTLAIDKLILEKTGMDEVSDTQLDLRAGRIMGNVKKLSAASHYEVKLPNGVAGIRGTSYMISASGVIYVINGSVTVTYVGANGQMVTQTITSGQSFDPSSGNPPQTIPQDTLTVLENDIQNMNYEGYYAPGTTSYTQKDKYKKKEDID
jgi:hypothetical protein